MIFYSPEVRVVEASAGSGKTYALAKRYIQLLLFFSSQLPLPMKHILAITFTNKASGEMKARIVDFLKKIALNQLTTAQQEDILKPLGLNPAQASRMAFGLMEDLIRQYHFFAVQTIDSFINALLAGCAFKINLSARFKIKRNSLDYLQLSLDELLSAAHSDRQVYRLFERTVRQYLFLENRSGWFVKDDFLKTLKILFDQYNIYQKPFLKFEEGEDIFVCKKQFMETLRQLHKQMPQGTHKNFANGLDDFLSLYQDSFDMDKVSTYFCREEFPVVKGAVVPGQAHELWEQARAQLDQIARKESYGVFNPYIDLFTAVMGYFHALQVKDDVLFLEELNKKARTLFDEGLVTVEELYYRLATRFNHYLIDEFQDTNASQWQNLRLMVEEALSTGGTLFYVGDKKQAIYSFRGGESHLFDALQKVLGDFNVVRETLSKNYRSHRAIVEFNNHLFSLEHLRDFINQFEESTGQKGQDIAFNEADWQAIEAVFGQAKQSPREDLPHGFVRAAVVEGRRKEERDQIIRQKVIAAARDAHERFAWRDIAVLTRNNEEVQKVTQWLLEEGIYAQSERTSDIKTHPLIQEIVAFLKFLHSPIDNLCFARFLLGDLFPKAAGMDPREIREFLFQCRPQKNAHAQVYLYKQFRGKYPQVWEEYFEGFFKDAGIYPLYELMIAFCACYRCEEFFPESQGFLMHFLELVKRKEEDSCDVETFVPYFEALDNEERFVPMPDQDAVRILTIHKSKGLEFPVVIIPFLEMTIRVGAGDRNGSQSFIWTMDEDGMRLLRLKQSYTLFSSELKARYKMEYKKAFLAELNNIYVALTRAKWELYVFIPERVGNSPNPALLLIPSDQFLQGKVMPPTETTKVIERMVLPGFVYKPWISRLREESDQSSAVQARVQGKAVHWCLAQLGNLSTADVPAVIHQTVEGLRRNFPLVNNAPEYEQYLIKFLGRADVRPFFYLPVHAQVICEQAIVNAFGDTRRIDRLIIVDREVWIVDYKSSDQEDAKHQQQIKEYVELVQQLYSGYKIKEFLIYLYGPSSGGC